MRSVYPHRHAFTLGGLALFAMTATFLCGSAQAGPTYGFVPITANSPASMAAGQAQLSVEVDALGDHQVVFTFANSGPLASSITDVYFQDGPMLGIATINDACPGVQFSQYASPANPPGGNTLTPPFVTTEGFSADSDAPVQFNGVNPGEWLGIAFNLKPGENVTDVINGLNDGSLRIAVHVQGFQNGCSEAFVNTPGGGTPAVPAPAGFLLAGIGTALVTRLRRRKAV